MKPDYEYYKRRIEQYRMDGKTSVGFVVRSREANKIADFIKTLGYEATIERGRLFRKISVAWPFHPAETIVPLKKDLVINAKDLVAVLEPTHRKK